MSSPLLIPELRRVLDGISRRLEILERRVNPNVAELASSRHTHNGTGPNSTVGSHSGDTGLIASGTESLAVGHSANAGNDYTIAVGPQADATGLTSLAVGTNAEAGGDYSLAFGPDAAANGEQSVAIGMETRATHDSSVALGDFSETSGTYQVNFGGKRAFIGAPNSAAADATLIANQLTFYIDQTANTLVVKVKYSTGTVKTGTVALV